MSFLQCLVGGLVKHTCHKSMASFAMYMYYSCIHVNMQMVNICISNVYAVVE